MKGRRPNEETVVPFTGDGGNDERMRERGRQIAAELKPDYLSPGAAAIYDRLAPILCNPTINRLREPMLEAFVLLCEARARHERLRRYLATPGVDETYISKTRNGEQIKCRPEVGQLNETFRQFLTLARDFGLTPAAERGLKSAGPSAEADLFEDDFT